MNRIEAHRWKAAEAAKTDASPLVQARPRLQEWRERRRLRQALARVPARDLRDAGLSREAVGHEVAQPFWRPLGLERK